MHTKTINRLIRIKSIIDDIDQGRIMIGNGGGSSENENGEYSFDKVVDKIRSILNDESELETTSFDDNYKRGVRNIKAIINSIDNHKMFVTVGNDDFNTQENIYDYSVIVGMIGGHVYSGLGLNVPLINANRKRGK